MESPPAYQRFVGVDIAATTFTVSAAEAQRPMTYPQTPDGFASLHQHLVATGPATSLTLVVMESTSSYGVALAVTSYEAGYQVAVVNPKHIHQYAQSLPRRSKTDALDAAVLRQFAAERQPRPWTPPPLVYHQLRQRFAQGAPARDAVAEMRQQARNQRHALQQWPVVIDTVVAHFDALEADLDCRIAALDAEIARVLRTARGPSRRRCCKRFPALARAPPPGCWSPRSTLSCAARPKPPSPTRV